MSPVNKDEYAAKLKQIAEKVETTTDELDEFIIDTEEARCPIAELTQLEDERE